MKHTHLWITTLLSLVVLSGCTLWPKTSTTSGTVLNNNAIAAELKQLGKMNRDPMALKPDEYPQALGTYEKDGLPLAVRYFCSDVCPNYARLELVYADIDNKADCAKVDGKNIIDPAWGGYIGCEPKVTKE